MSDSPFTFFGTDDFAVTVLITLADLGLKPQLIITTPDKPSGRQLILTPPPVKVWAKENKIPFHQPDKLSTLAPNSLFLVASYGKIIPEQILSLPTHGTLNIHPSLLPKYRGATPLQSAILNGDTATGVTIIKLDKEVDHGPIVAQESFSLTNQPDITYPELREALAKSGAQLFAKILPDWLEGKIEAREQNHSQATFTKKIIKQAGEIKLDDDPLFNYRKYRAFLPWPGIYFFDQGGKRIIIKKAKLENGHFTPVRIVPEGGKEKTAHLAERKGVRS